MLFPDHIGLDGFLRDYWQRRPLLMRQAIDPNRLSLPAEELAGLACEAEIESRLITGPDPQWQVRAGPFDEAVFASLPDHHWTLLVQDVDKYRTDVAALLDAFLFIPDWRLDDIMISYAEDGGGVGPHTDQYDVFLVQGQGQRRWRISSQAYAAQDLVEDCPLRVLKHFETEEDWVLNPGDVLYLPPGVAHWGTAIGACMTWSVGMRGAPDHDLAAAWLEHRQHFTPAQLMTDHAAEQTGPAAQVLSADIAQSQQLIGAALDTKHPDYARWLGAYLTEPKPGFEFVPEPGALDIAELKAYLEAGGTLIRHPWVRLAYLPDIDPPRLCWQGQCQTFAQESAALIECIVAQRSLGLEQLEPVLKQPDDWNILLDLINQELLIIDEQG